MMYIKIAIAFVGTVRCVVSAGGHEMSSKIQTKDPMDEFVAARFPTARRRLPGSAGTDGNDSTAASETAEATAPSGTPEPVASAELSTCTARVGNAAAHAGQVFQTYPKTVAVATGTAMGFGKFMFAIGFPCSMSYLGFKIHSAQFGLMCGGVTLI